MYVPASFFFPPLSLQCAFYPFRAQALTESDIQMGCYPLKQRWVAVVMGDRMSHLCLAESCARHWATVPASVSTPVRSCLSTLRSKNRGFSQ